MSLPPNQATRASGSQPALADGRVLVMKLSVALVLLTLGVFLPVVDLNWVNYDDDVFVTNNPMVAPGLTWAGVKWAFSSADIDYWRPLSWLSHMLDIELFGAAAGGHHLSSLLIHCAAVVMAFLALARLTRAPWPSAVVAALFAWHPLHVESVAWVAERKDVLCGFFWFFTLWSHARHAEQPGLGRYLTMFAGFMLGLMSKPMIVTLPFVLLLLDVWPLRRLNLPAPAAGAEGWRAWRGTLQKLVWEKVPLFVAVALIALATMVSQHRVGTMSGLAGVPLPDRVAGALAGYGAYVSQTFLPAHLCVLYPFALLRSEVWQWLGSGLLIALVLGAGCRWARTRPFVLVGWLWFLGVLVPVIGLVQVGEQAHADRYTYLSLTGICLLVAWSTWEWAAGDARRLRVWAALWLAVLAACAVGTRLQLRHWENTEALFQRALNVTSGNTTAMNNLASGLMARGRGREAIPYLREAIRLHPFQQNAYFNLGWIYAELGDEPKSLENMALGFAQEPGSRAAAEQITGLSGSVQANPGDTLKRKMLAKAYAIQGNPAAAADQLAIVLRLVPADVNVGVEHAALLAESGRVNEAVTALQATVGMAPTNTLARRSLAALLSRADRFDAAAAQLREASTVGPDDLGIQIELAVVLSRGGRTREACRQLEAVLQRDPTNQSARLQLAWLLATRAECRDGAAALRHAQQAFDSSPTRSPDLLDTLAAAYAAAGNFARAVTAADMAIAATPPGETSLRTTLQQRRERYLSGQPYTEQSPRPPPQP